MNVEPVLDPCSALVSLAQLDPMLGLVMSLLLWELLSAAPCCWERQEMERNDVTLCERQREENLGGNVVTHVPAKNINNTTATGLVADKF